MNDPCRELVLRLGKAQVDAMFGRQDEGPVIDDAEFVPLVESVLTALSGIHAGVFNIGTGVATSVNQLLASLTSVLGPPPGVRQAPARPAEVLRACVDPSKAAREGLWHPRTALDEGLRRTAAAEGVLLS